MQIELTRVELLAIWSELENAHISWTAMFMGGGHKRHLLSAHKKIEEALTKEDQTLRGSNMTHVWFDEVNTYSKGQAAVPNASEPPIVDKRPTAEPPKEPLR